MSTETSKNQENKPKIEENTKPNEKMGFEFSSMIKIFDPDTQKVYVQTRAD